MKRWSYLAIIWMGGIILYLPSLKYWFSQDDFIHLSASNAYNIKDFLNFFNPFYHYPDIFFYRPLSTEVYFFVNHSLFGLNPLPFHLEGLIFHLINSLLFFIIVAKLWKNKSVAFVSALLYAVSAIHFLSLYYISAFQEIIRITFLLLSILLFINYQEKHRKLFYALALLSFIAALLSKETSVILPLLLFPVEILRKEKTKAVQVLKETLKPSILFILFSFSYGLIRLAGFQSIFNQGAYSTISSFGEIVQNFKWYLLWAFGLPEVISSSPSLKPNSLLQFLNSFPFGAEAFYLFIIVFTVTIILLPQIRKLSPKVNAAALVIFFVSLAPVLTLHQHLYPQYLDLAFLGFLPILTWLFLQSDQPQKTLGILGITFFIVLQYCSLNLSEQTHWTTHRATVAKFYYQEFQTKYPSINQPLTVAFVGNKQATSELSYALAGKYALSVWYPHKIYQVAYTDSNGAQKLEGKPIIFQITNF